MSAHKCAATLGDGTLPSLSSGHHIFFHSTSCAFLPHTRENSYNRTKKADPEIGILAPPSVKLSPDQGDILKVWNERRARERRLMCICLLGRKKGNRQMQGADFQ